MTSIRHKMALCASEFKQGIRKTALQGLMNQDGGVVGTEKVFGYVCNIHSDDEEEYAGTVDVQEYNYNGEEDGESAGLHEGVKLSAIQNNKTGYKIVPQLYSDVVIVQDPISLEEYVIMYSHVQLIQLKSYENIEIGVTEHEPFKESGDGLEKDYYELEEKENKSYSTYDKENLKHGVESKDSKSMTEITAIHTKTSVVGDTTAYHELTASEFVVDVAGKAKITVTGSNIRIEVGSSNVELDGSLVNVNGKDTEAVRYKELEEWLKKLCLKISTGLCATGSPISTAAEIGQMPSEIKNFKSGKVKLS